MMEPKLSGRREQTKKITTTKSKSQNLIALRLGSMADAHESWPYLGPCACTIGNQIFYLALYKRAYAFSMSMAKLFLKWTEKLLSGRILVKKNMLKAWEQCVLMLLNVNLKWFCLGKKSLLAINFIRIRHLMQIKSGRRENKKKW